MARVKDAVLGVLIVDRGSLVTPRVLVLEAGQPVDDYDCLEDACADWPSGLVVDREPCDEIAGRVFPATDLPGVGLVGRNVRAILGQAN